MEREKEPALVKYELIFPAGLDNGLTFGAINLINEYSKKGLMLPASAEHYLELAKMGALIVAKEPNYNVIGAAAYTQFYDNGIWEFGGWVVDEKYQHQGIGFKLIKELFEKRPHFKTIAFGNKNSGPILEQLGAKIIKDHSILPHAAFELCSTCPKKPAVGCCDTIYNLGPVVEKIAMPDTSWISPRQLERLVYGIGEGQWGPFSGFQKEPEDWK